MQTLNQDIKKQQFRQVYLLYGEETFLKNSYKKRLKEAIVGQDEMNFSYYEGKKIDVDALIRQADTMPFFASHRLIMVEESGFFKNACEPLAEYLPEMPETTCLLFVESEVDRRGKLFKRVAKLGHTAQMDRQDVAQLRRWIDGILAKEDKKINSRARELLLGMTGNDMQGIYMELEKLISYAGSRSLLTEDDVKAICTEHTEVKIFEMIDAIASGQTKKAIEKYEDLLLSKESPMFILYMIVRQFNQILQAKEYAAQGMNKNAIAAKMKLHPFIAGLVLQQARRFTREQILSYLAMCAYMEEKAKSGRLRERLTVELLIAYMNDGK